MFLNCLVFPCCFKTLNHLHLYRSTMDTTSTKMVVNPSSPHPHPVFQDCRLVMVLSPPASPLYRLKSTLISFSKYRLYVTFKSFSSFAHVVCLLIDVNKGHAASARAHDSAAAAKGELDDLPLDPPRHPSLPHPFPHSQGHDGWESGWVACFLSPSPRWNKETCVRESKSLNCLHDTIMTSSFKLFERQLSRQVLLVSFVSHRLDTPAPVLTGPGSVIARNEPGS